MGILFGSGKGVKTGAAKGSGVLKMTTGSGRGAGTDSRFGKGAEGGGGVGRTGGSTCSADEGGASCRRRPSASIRSPKSPNSCGGSVSGREGPERLGFSAGGNSSCPCRFRCIHHCARLARTKRIGTSHSTAEGDYFEPALPESLAIAALISVSAETLRIFW